MTRKEQLVKVGAAKNFWSTYDVETLDIQSLYMNDGPHGVRATNSSDIIVTDNELSTCFPTSSAMASSWNKELIYSVGQAIGKEARANGIQVLLGPGVNLKRSPVGGRNFEYYSEDVTLTSEIASSFVKGVQSQDVAACLKHYVLNEQEVERMTINCIVDEYTLYNTYIKTFRDIINEASPMMIMSSYNKVNGQKVTESKYLLNDILRDKLAFKGTIVSDWGAVENPVQALNAGVDFDMPFMGEYQTKDILESDLSEKTLEERYQRIYEMTSKLSFDKLDVDYEVHHKLAQKVAEESIVLLNNKDKLLPLSSDKTIGIVGDFFKKPRIQGAGSSKVKAYKISDFESSLVKRQVEFEYFDKNDSSGIEDFAKKHDYLIYFTGLNEMDESEGVDRSSITLADDENMMINQLYDLNSDLIVVLNNGTAVDFDRMGDINTLIEVWLSGQAIGEAFWNIMYGDVNPSGKLSETFPLSKDTHPVLKVNPYEVLYSEGSLLGYKYYDYYEKDVRFPFGYGLSYSEFSISDIDMSLNETGISVTYTIENISDIDGAEVVQIYYGQRNSDYKTPVKDLIAFEKIFLKAGEKKSIDLEIPIEKFEKYDLKLCDYYLSNMEILLSLGTSSRDIIYTKEVSIEASKEYKLAELNKLGFDSICKDFYNNQVTRAAFVESFSYLQERDLFDIILDMPLNLIYRLFPDLIPYEKVAKLMKLVNEQKEAFI
ncbi:hypothetical protein EZV73_18745 [Acidaminobacter sp. JC074]|uniref:beta-glucosidase n=1 Tax=Acidaminobacter sp. JC074 TaxID=2530199 RepID=UPI001F109678|nr:glycoside hydrolase family 3 N-terminal domain-containing protein [Acidaminobacter sp. JC074]MCH4889628.1 hypothetical protein [Acidaminobacter sp. JC074]